MKALDLKSIGFAPLSGSLFIDSNDHNLLIPKEIIDSFVDALQIDKRDKKLRHEMLRQASFSRNVFIEKVVKHLLSSYHLIGILHVKPVSYHWAESINRESIILSAYRSLLSALITGSQNKEYDSYVYKVLLSHDEKLDYSCELDLAVLCDSRAIVYHNSLLRKNGRFDEQKWKYY